MSLNTAEIAAMTATVTGSLPETVSVLRNTPTSDGQGGQTPSWATAFTVAARRDDLDRSDELVIADTLESITGYAVILPANTAVRQSDRLQFSDGMLLEILGFGTNGPWQLAQRCVCRLVGGS